MKISLKTAGWIVFILLAVYYILNRFPGVAFIDSGELALCSFTLGVPHPTGYPLYLVLTAPAAQFFARPITGVTFMAGILTALAGFVFFHIIGTLRKRFFPERDKCNIGAIAATLILFLAPVVAAQGVTNEVYSLALLINLAVVFSAIKAMFCSGRSEKSRYMVLTWYLAGMSLCNHMSSIQLLPGLALITVLAFRRNFSFRLLIMCGIAVVIPLTVYAVLPIRAMADPAPIANWGGVGTWDNLVRHVSGWQFQVWMFAGDLSQIWANFTNFAAIVYSQFPVVILPFAAAGIYFMSRRAAGLMTSILAIMAVNIWLGINYSIPDIDSYYLLTIALLMLLAVVGLYFAGSRIRIRHLLPGVVVVLFAWQSITVWNENYMGDYTLPEDYALNICRSADSNAVIMSEIWDHHGQAFYLQQAEGVRRDLKFIDKELLRRSWYYATIKNAYPDLYNKIADLVPPFVNEVKVFEKGGNFDAGVLEHYFQAIINRLLTDCGPAYIDNRLTYTPDGHHYLRPQGILYKLDTIQIGDPLPQPQLVWRGRSHDSYTDRRALVHTDMIKGMESYWNHRNKTK